MRFCFRSAEGWRTAFLVLGTSLAVTVGTQVHEARADDAVEELRRTIRELERSRAAQEKQIRQLEERLRLLEQKGAEAASKEKERALDRALEESTPAAPAPLPSVALSPAGPRLRLLDVSFDVLAAAGWSTATDDQLGGRLQAGAHDPLRRGFTLQQGELSLTGAVDPYLTGESHVIFTSDYVELEEAFMTTTSLPFGLEGKAGFFFTEYGLLNPLHPHAWDWMDQPVILSRIMGSEGLRATGARLSWLMPLPWFSELYLGVQNANEGGFTTSFISPDAVGNRPTVERPTRRLTDLLYLTRWEQFWDLTPQLGLKLGANFLHGPNATGGDGETWVYGLDWKVRWRPQNNFRGWPFFLWQTEIHKRDYTAAFYVPGAAAPPADDGHGHSHGDGSETTASEEVPSEPIPGAILRDAGFYTQALYGFRYGWASGIRLEYASGSGQSLGGRQNDPLRDDRWRISPLLVWHPTEYSRFRLQYNYDRARFLDERDAHSVWLGGEVLYGAHPVHKY